jgi:hypothetical protein
MQCSIEQHTVQTGLILDLLSFAKRQTIQKALTVIS